MNTRLFSLFTLLILSFSPIQSMQQEEGAAHRWLQSAKKLTANMPSMQDISNSIGRAKDATIEFGMKNPYTIAAVIGATATITGIATYLYSKKSTEKSLEDKPEVAFVQVNLPSPILDSSVEAPVSIAQEEASNQKAVAKPVIEPGETVDVSNDSDYEFSIEIKIPARTYALLQMSKQISVIKK